MSSIKPETRTCIKHGKLNLSEFYIYKSESRTQHQCKLCRKLKSKSDQQRKAKWYKAYKRKWWSENKDKSSSYRKKDIESRRARRRESYHRIRLEVLTHYSGGNSPYCDCCGDTHLQFLALDHKKSDGAQHRKSIGTSGGGRMCEWAKKNNYPDMFRVLCHNCNFAYGAYGCCPHQPTISSLCVRLQQSYSRNSSIT